MEKNVNEMSYAEKVLYIAKFYCNHNDYNKADKIISQFGLSSAYSGREKDDIDQMVDIINTSKNIGDKSYLLMWWF